MQNLNKQFYKDFILEAKPIKSEIISTSIDYELNEGICDLIKVKCILKMDYISLNKELEYLIEIPNLKLECEKKEDIKIEIEKIDSLISFPHLVIYGNMKIMVNEDRLSSFNIDPFKKDLLDSFLNFKREQNDVEVISTIKLDEKKDDEDQIIIKKEFDEKIDSNLKKEELFKENYKQSILYYRVKENETLNEILQRFNVTKEIYLKFNKDVDLKEGMFIKLKI